MKNYFGQNIKYLRQKNNMTQTNLGELLHLSHQAVSNYEKGKRYCDLDVIISVSEIFKISIDDLLKKKLD